MASHLARPISDIQPATLQKPTVSPRLVRAVGRFAFSQVVLWSYLFLWLPIVLLVVFSFNDSRALTHWAGFSLRWYEALFNGAIGSDTVGSFSSRLMLDAFSKSLTIGIYSTLISTVIGTLVAVSLARGKFWGKKWIDSMLFFPLVIPDITQAFSLALFFKIVFDFIQATSGIHAVSGLGTIVIGHVAFNISYVAFVVRGRLADMNPRYEEAAADLGATPIQAFLRITLPLLLPGIIAGALLAFTMSLDDFIVSFLLSGVGTSTLPVYVQALVKQGITPEVNAISTVMLVLSTVLVGASLFLQNARTRF